MKLTNPLTQIKATRNATMNPKANATISVLLNVPNPTSPWNFTIFNSDAPAMIGMARKNENSEATFESNPEIQPPIMVDEDLDIPGQRDRHWNRPTLIA